MAGGNSLRVLVTFLYTSEICPYCRKARNPHDIIRRSSFTICIDCQQRHDKALAALSTGQYTGNCSECGLSVDEIKDMQGDGDTGTRMVIHYENGIYKPMCVACDRAYVPKRADLYGDTQFWKNRGL